MSEVAKKEEKSLSYNIGQQKIELTISYVRKYLISGKAELVTDEEIVGFMKLCEYQKLNPFIREAYLIKYSTNNPASMVISYEAYLKRAKEDPKYDGMESGIIVQTNNKPDEIPEAITGAFLPPYKKLLGGWAKIYEKGIERPTFFSLGLESAIKKKSDGSLTEFWRVDNQPFMIEKTAIARALKRAFPNALKGIYTEEEILEEKVGNIPYAEEVPSDTPTNNEANHVIDIVDVPNKTSSNNIKDDISEDDFN